MQPELTQKIDALCIDIGLTPTPKLRQFACLLIEAAERKMFRVALGGVAVGVACSLIVVWLAR
jgi:hypothetical protein